MKLVRVSHRIINKLLIKTTYTYGIFFGNPPMRTRMILNMSPRINLYELYLIFVNVRYTNMICKLTFYPFYFVC